MITEQEHTGIGNRLMRSQGQWISISGDDLVTVGKAAIAREAKHWHIDMAVKGNIEI